MSAAASAARSERLSLYDRLELSGNRAAKRCININASSRRRREAVAPAVAFCIAGAARSFSAPLVQQALLHHLVRAYGGANGSRVFYLLKTADSDKMHEVTGGRFRMKYVARTADANALMSALGTWQRANLLGEALVLHGSGVHTHSDVERRPRDPNQEAAVATARANSTAWRLYRSRCVDTHDTPGVWQATPSSVAVQRNASNTKALPYLAYGNNEERLIANHLSLSWCREASACCALLRCCYLASVTLLCGCKQ